MTESPTPEPAEPAESEAPEASVAPEAVLRRPGWRSGDVPGVALLIAVLVWAFAVLLVAGTGSAAGVAGAAVLLAAGVAVVIDWAAAPLPQDPADGGRHSKPRAGQAYRAP